MKTLLEPAEWAAFPLGGIDGALLALSAHVLLVVLNRPFEKTLRVLKKSTDPHGWGRYGVIRQLFYKLSTCYTAVQN